MIRSMEIENYKCFSKFKIEGLGPFNVLVGPNDSGKTAFLEAIRLLAAFPGEGTQKARRLVKQLHFRIGRESIWRQRRSHLTIAAEVSAKDWDTQTVRVTSENGEEFTFGFKDEVVVREKDLHWIQDFLAAAIGRTEYYRLDPGALRQPSPLSKQMTETGEGFPTYLDDIGRADDDDQVFSQLKSEFYRRFPYYRTIVIAKTVVGAQRQGAFHLQFKTVKDEVLPAEGVSDGVMVSLAMIALSYSPQPPRILLIEEPENHVHHASLKDIITTLRDLSQNKDVQVVLTTHSPYLLDLVEPGDVWVFCKDNREGTVRATNLAKHPDVEKMKKHFMTGEIWTGLDESDIVKKARGEK